MAVVPTPGRLLRAADIRVPNADSSAVALESSSAGSRVSKFRIGTGPRKASRSTTRAIRGRELPKSTVGFLLPGPQEIVPSTVPFAQVRRCAPGRRRPENQSRPHDRLFPPCNPVELSATFRPLPGDGFLVKEPGPATSTTVPPPRTPDFEFSGWQPVRRHDAMKRCLARAGSGLLVFGQESRPCQDAVERFSRGGAHEVRLPHRVPRSTSL